MNLVPLIPRKESKGKAPVEDSFNRISQSQNDEVNRANDARQNYNLNGLEQKSFSDYTVSTSLPLEPDEDNRSESPIRFRNQTCSTEESNSTSNSEGDYPQKVISSQYSDDEESSSEESDQSNFITRKNWKQINDQLKKNDPSVASLNIRFVLTNIELHELSHSLKKNTALGHISWHNDQDPCDTTAKIEVQLIKSNKNYRHHPNDFVHILLSKHVYKNSQKGDRVQVDPNIDKHLKNWKVKAIYDDTNSSGYYAVIYKNDKTHQIVLAIRGTEGGGVGVLKSLLKKNSDWKTNLEEILGGQIVVGQQARNYQATHDAIKIAEKKKYRLSFTGHSLGAWLAELSMFYSQVYFKYYNVKAVTFDSPGTLPMMEKLQSNIVNRNTCVKLKDLNIVTYLATPNPVNCCNSHIGEVRCVEVDMEWTDYADDKVPDCMKNIIGDKIQGVLAIEGHGLSKMLREFDPLTGRPRKCDKMADWPRMEYHGEAKDFASNAIGLMQVGIEKGVNCIGFQSSIATTLTSKTIGTLANWLIGDKTIMTIIGFLMSVITGEVDQEQYWEYFKHLNLQGSDLDTSRKKIEQNFDHRFALVTKAHFRKEEGGEGYIMSLKPGSSDKFLFELYDNKENLKRRKDLPQPVKRQLRDLLAAFTIKQLYDGKYQLVPNKGHDPERIKQNTQRLFQVLPIDHFQLSCKVIYMAVSKDNVPSKSKKKRDVSVIDSPQLIINDFQKDRNLLVRFASAPVKHNRIFSTSPAKLIKIIGPNADSKPRIVSNGTPKARLVGKKVEISIEDLSSPSFFSNFTAISSSVIYLRIKNPKELGQFGTLLLNSINKPLFNRTEGIDFSGLKINQNTINPFHICLASLSQNIKLFPNFTSLCIGDIDINQLMELVLPQSLSILTSLAIGKIHCSWARIVLPATLDHLTDFSVGSMSYGSCSFNALNKLDNLKNLTIGYMEGFIELPNSLKNLITLTIKQVAYCCELKFPDSLDYLRNCFIGNISGYCRITITCKLDKLENLSIGNIGERVAFGMPWKLKKLIHLSIGSIFASDNYFFVRLPDKLDNLTHLAIHNTAHWNLSGRRFDNLRELRIRDIWDCLKKDLPDSLPKLRSLIITDVSHNPVDRFASLSNFFSVGQNTVDLPRSFRLIETLHIENIAKNAVFAVPALFKKLTTIIIGNIGEKAILTLPNSLENLKTLSIDCIGKNATLKVPASFPQYTNFTINRILDHADLDITWSLDTQTAKAMKTTWQNAIIKSTGIGASKLQQKTIIDISSSENSDGVVIKPVNILDHITNHVNVVINRPAKTEVPSDESSLLCIEWP